MATGLAPQLRCRTCGRPATVDGGEWWGRAVHEGTGRELGDDGHLVAPVDPEMLAASPS
jgi:hypothetical protein